LLLDVDTAQRNTLFALFHIHEKGFMINNGCLCTMLI
jgi:hypothetical protein